MTGDKFDFSGAYEPPKKKMTNKRRLIITLQLLFAAGIVGIAFLIAVLYDQYGGTF
jgi:hypothetical protein